MRKKLVWLGSFLVICLFLSISGSAIAFTDVDEWDPYSEAITDLSSRGIISGFDGDVFRPNDPVTRQQFAKMIVNTLLLPVTEEDVCPFPDVQVGPNPADPLYPDNYVAKAAASEITEGYDDGTFRPYVSISRAHVITMVVRALGTLYPGVLDEVPTNIPVPDAFDVLLPEHASNMLTALLNGLLDGLDYEWGPDPFFSLFSFVTNSRREVTDLTAPMPRGEVAQVLHNLGNFVPRPVPFATYSGSGNDVVTIDKPLGPALLYARCHARGEWFGVQAYDASGEPLGENLAMATGPYEGVTPLDFGWGGGSWVVSTEQTARLEVMATGPWTIEIRPLSTARTLASPGTITGVGDEVFKLEGSATTALIDGNADSDGFFTVVDFNLATRFEDYLVDFTDTYHGRVVVESPGYIAVYAHGPWSFTAETGH